MPYITREDGVHFVIPSYRDVLATKQKTVLKKEILMLSQSYGEYITLQKKGAAQYEVAFSPDTGYLLGESIWHYFKRPLDMIYCESIPNTTEAILVIVKAGSVYLDGSFPLDTISEELVIFLTQQNNFEIYTYGDVPISQAPQEGKFSFDATSVKSFTILDKPVFPTLPLVKIYQLQLVDQVLKAHGIGVFPLKQLLMGIAVLGLLWMAYSYLKAPTVVTGPAPTANPYQVFNDTLASPAPEAQLDKIQTILNNMLTMPGWRPVKASYIKGTFMALVNSPGGSTTRILSDWAQENHYTIEIKQDGIYIVVPIMVPNRPIPTKIFALKDVLSNLVDRLSKVYPGNRMSLGEFTKKDVFTQVTITINFDSVSPVVFRLITQQFQDLPLVLQSIQIQLANGLINGQMILTALGN